MHDPDRSADAHPGRDRGHGVNGLDHTFETIDAMPNRYHAKQVRCPTGENKHTEGEENPPEFQVATLAHERKQHKRNGVIGQRNQAI